MADNNIKGIDPTQQLWDVIVIGTGIGGATTGFALAKAGQRVLFCEQGGDYSRNDSAIKGDYAEKQFPSVDYPQAKYHDILLRSGRWVEEIEDRSSSRPYRFIPFIGSGTGGSSALYGMAMERFHPTDFSPGRNFPEASSASLPDKWPISYEEMRPYYLAAERLYRVRGTADPLRKANDFDHYLEPPKLSHRSEELFQSFTKKGLHSYRLPLACEFIDGCEGCQGYLCDRGCKNDSVRCCLEPAINRFGACLLSDCEVIKIEATRSEITAIQCSYQGHLISLRAKIVILAAGALATPKILLNSSSPIWPNGLANSSGLVGKNLMRHYIDLYVVFLKNSKGATGNVKELAFNDLYITPTGKYGTVQSFGPMLPSAIIVSGMIKDLQHSKFPWIGSLLELARPIMTVFFDKLFKQCLVFATIIEDLPYESNCVEPTDSINCKLAINYKINQYEQNRIKIIRKEVKRIFQPYRIMLIKQAENNERIAHACGTCRFGHDHENSVLDATNRAHGIKNLYVVDSSFFPSSGGTNPALTIAANALRVADHLIEKRDML